MYLILLIALCLLALMFCCADSNDSLGEEVSSYKKCCIETLKQKQGKSSYIPWSNVINAFCITQNISQLTSSEFSIDKGFSTAALWIFWDKWFFCGGTCSVHCSMLNDNPDLYKQMPIGSLAPLHLTTNKHFSRHFQVSSSGQSCPWLRAVDVGQMGHLKLSFFIPVLFYALSFQCSGKALLMTVSVFLSSSPSIYW